MVRHTTMLLLAFATEASALVAPTRRASVVLRSTPPESGASPDSTADAATDAVAVDAAALEAETAVAVDTIAVKTKFRGVNANKPKPYEDFNPDQPDIVQKFVKQRDDWWSADSPFPGADLKEKGEGPIEALGKIPVPAYLWLLTSTVGAIAFVGCIFQLFYNVPAAPVLGVPLTALILVTSGPAFIVLFLAAIARGQREADEDDAKYR